MLAAKILCLMSVTGLCVAFYPRPAPAKKGLVSDAFIYQFPVTLDQIPAALQQGHGHLAKGKGGEVADAVIARISVLIFQFHRMQNVEKCVKLQELDYMREYHEMLVCLISPIFICLSLHLYRKKLQEYGNGNSGIIDIPNRLSTTKVIGYGSEKLNVGS